MGEGVKYLTGTQVADRYHITDVTLWRWLKDDGLCFPQPMRINRRRFFREDELVEWERTRSSVSA
ncbi:helix-turn-helix protein [Rhizobium sp. BK251]|nr:helix-turn-helix domain-containing protein [Rhizobium sp. BK251]TCL70563.1 helix-turn-helix protein [Rhizobium sp. BK251]